MTMRWGVLGAALALTFLLVFTPIGTASARAQMGPTRFDLVLAEKGRCW